MNQPPYMDVHSSHLPPAQPYTSQPGPVDTMHHYPQYQQPPLLQSGPTTYAPNTSAYPQYGYSTAVTCPQSSQPVSGALTSGQILPPPAMTPQAPPSHGYVPGPSHSQPYMSHAFDTTGQLCPPNMKPRVTATLWEDEGCLCFQVEAKGVCVARRDDNHMINGTKLLNVAGMTRGRRDGILKSEKVRHVVKIGPMHLKGVWIPYERALDFANKEKITPHLYPLFVQHISGLLQNDPTKPQAHISPADRARAEANHAARSAQGPPAPALHHHHSMHNPVTPQASQPQSSLIPQAGRPNLERAHTFPTPPASASSLVGTTNQGSSYEWTGSNLANNVQGSHQLSIDTGLSHAKSMPTTPATTPPGSNMQNMPSYQSQATYDTSKPYYSSAPPSQPQYVPPQSVTQQSMPGQTNGSVGHGVPEGETPQDHGAEYINGAATGYAANRTAYSYNPTSTPGALQGEHPQLSPEMTGSTNSANDPDRMANRASGLSQWNSGYSTPRLGPPSSLYNIVSDTRSTINGTASEPYSTPSNAATGYSSSVNGSNKRGRDEDEEQNARPESQNSNPSFEHKRRKTLMDSAIGGPVGGASIALQSMKNGAVARRR